MNNRNSLWSSTPARAVVVAAILASGVPLASAAGNFTDTPGVPNLNYDPATGNVTLDADGGANITGFQLESAGQFLPANYISQSGGGFGGVFENISDSVLADSDLTFAGQASLDLGNVLATNLDQTALEALLTTADFSAGLGNSGVFDLIVPTNFELRLSTVRNGSDFDFTWTSRANKVYDLLSSTDLSGAPSTWAVYDPDGPGGDPPLAGITPSGTGSNSLPSVPSVDSRRFFTIAERPLELLFEDFENGVTPPDGFPDGWIATVEGGAGTAWEVGVPSGGVGPAAAANGSNCAGTNIGGEYSNDVEVTLTSPSFSVPVGASATLSYNWVLDLNFRPPDVASVRILDAGTDLPIAGLETTYTRASVGPEVTTWAPDSLLLPAADVAGKNIKVEFRFVSGQEGGGFAPTSRGGFYIDDVVVTVN